MIPTKIKIRYLCLLVLISTSCQEPSFDLDDTIQQCYDATYQKEGYDIKSIIDDYERLLIQQGVIEDGSGKSYLDVVQRIASDPAFRLKVPPFQKKDPILKVPVETRKTVFECEKEMVASAKGKDSKWQTLDSLLQSPEILANPNLIRQAFEESLSKADLNSYYFKLKMFQVFDGANANWGSPSDRSSGPR